MSTDPAVQAIRDGWPGHHFTRDGALFSAPTVRDGGATATLIEYAVAVTRQQVAREIEERVPDSHPVYGYRDGLQYAAKIARGDS